MLQSMKKEDEDKIFYHLEGKCLRDEISRWHLKVIKEHRGERREDSNVISGMKL